MNMCGAKAETKDYNSRVCAICSQKILYRILAQLSEEYEALF